MALTRALNRMLGTNLGPWDLARLPDVYVAVIVEGLALEGELAEAGLLSGN